MEDSKEKFRKWIEERLDKVPDDAVMNVSLRLSYWPNRENLPESNRASAAEWLNEEINPPGEPARKRWQHGQVYVTGRQPDPDKMFHSITDGIVV